MQSWILRMLLVFFLYQQGNSNNYIQSMALSASLPSCPLTPSLLLDRQALSLPETQDNCHFTNRGHCNTARQPQHTVNKQSLHSVTPVAPPCQRQ